MALPEPAISDVVGALALDARCARRPEAAGQERLRRQALAAAAGQFEALFMQMLLKSMREALPQDGPFASETTKTYTAMFDQQMAQQLSKKGVGIADMLVKQLSNAAHGGSRTRQQAPGQDQRRARAAPVLRLDDRAAAHQSRRGCRRLTRRRASGREPAATRRRNSSTRCVRTRKRRRRQAGIPVQYPARAGGLETGWGRQPAARGRRRTEPQPVRHQGRDRLERRERHRGHDRIRRRQGGQRDRSRSVPTGPTPTRSRTSPD